MRILHQKNGEIRFHNRENLDFPIHLHDVLEVAFLRSGTATAVCANRRYQLSAGDVFLCFPNMAHGYEDSRDVQCDVMIVPTGLLPHWRNPLSQKLPVDPVLLRGSWEHTQIPALLDMIREQRKQLSEPVKQGYAMVIAGKLFSLLHLTDRQGHTGGALQQILEYLGEHYGEPLSRGELARGVGYNESYISHVFAEQLGTSLKSYITSLRIQDAQELLADTDLTISQISLQLGFGSIRSFNRAFAREVGCSPTTYREKKSQ